MSVFGKIFAVLMWIVIIICIFCAIYVGFELGFLGQAVTAAIAKIGWVGWLLFAMLAYMLGCLLAPESMAAVTNRVATGLVRLANSAARVVRGVVSAAVSAIPTSVWVLLAVGVGIWLVSKKDSSSAPVQPIVLRESAPEDKQVNTELPSGDEEQSPQEEQNASEAQLPPAEKGGQDVVVV